MEEVGFTLAHWCVFVAALLPLACSWIAKSPGFGKRVREGGYDNREPRAWLARQQGLSARANAAQANSFEALPFFIAAVLVAQQLAADRFLLDALAVAFVVLRLAYIALYAADRNIARSVVWALGFLVNIAIFFLGFR